MNQQLHSKKLNRALSRLVENDSYLLEYDANERSISHRLAVYLEQEYPEWHVDCEYNRDIDNPKRLDLVEIHTESTDTGGTTVFPDIIIHQRGKSDNLLVIEMKKTISSTSDTFDYQKLHAFKEQLGYEFAVFVKMKIGCEFGYEDPVWR